MRNCHIAQEALLNALWLPKWEGNPKKRVYMYTYGQLNGHEFEQTLGDGQGQGSLACCTSRGHKELYTTEQLNNKNS